MTHRELVASIIAFSVIGSLIMAACVGSAWSSGGNWFVLAWSAAGVIFILFILVSSIFSTLGELRRRRERS